MRLGKPKSGICSHSTLFNMEGLAQLVRAFVLRRLYFHNIVVDSDERSYFAYESARSQVQVLYPSLSVVWCMTGLLQYIHLIQPVLIFQEPVRMFLPHFYI